MDVVKLVGRVVALGTGVVKGRGSDAFVVTVQFSKGNSLNGKDHINVFPNQWESAKIVTSSSRAAWSGASWCSWLVRLSLIAAHGPKPRLGGCGIKGCR